LANNSTLKELDVSSNVWKERGRDKGDGPGFVQELAVGLIDNGAMTSLNLASNNLGGWNGYSGGGAKYDTSGKQNLTCWPLLQIAPGDDLYLQALSPLPMPSPTWGPYRYCL
jgi:hypothetical protein